MDVVIYHAYTSGLVLLCINKHTKFKVPSFTNSKDMIGGAKYKKRVS